MPVLTRGYCLLLLFLWPLALTAQNGITISNLSATAGTVTFNVRWANNSAMPALWSDTVWVFVDYNDEGAMTRLPLSAGATLTATSAPGVGKVMEVSGNDQGVWVVGNARTAGNFTATVKLLTTVGTDGVHPAPTAACAYASNYPPAGKYEPAGTIRFTGTPPYVLRFADGSVVTLPCSGMETACTYSIPGGATLTSFTDATGAPGTFTQPLAPADPEVTPAARCGAGTLTLGATSAGAVIDWYAAATGGVPLQSGSNTFTTPHITASTTYYAQARYADTGETSARVAVTATVNLFEGAIEGQED